MDPRAESRETTAAGSGRDVSPEVRQVIHDLGNKLTRILSSAEFLEAEVAENEAAVADARSIREAALEGRDLIAELYRRSAASLQQE